MSKKYKIIIGALAAVCVLLIGISVWLYAQTKTMKSGRELLPVEPLAEPSAPASRGELVISEFMEKNRAVIRDEDGDFSDWVELYNPSEEPVELRGWSIADSESGRGWTFQGGSVAGGEYLLVFLSGKDRQGEPPHTDFSLSGDEGLYLRDGDGELCSFALCGGCDKDVAMAAGAEGAFAQSLYPTPGYSNDASGLAAFQSSLVYSGPLVINEAVVSNFQPLLQSGKGDGDWVEIKNVSQESVLLSDYYLSDDSDDYFLWQLPDMSLLPGQMLIVMCDGTAADMKDGLAYASFALNGENDQLYLTDAAGQLIDYMSLRDIPYLGSYGRMASQPGYYYFEAVSPWKDAQGALKVSDAPVSLREDGVFDSVESVAAELSARGSIYYTLDGSLPTEASAEYTGPITINFTSVLRAISVEPDALPSRALTLSYIINEGHTLPVVSLAADSPWAFDQMYDAGNKTVELPGNLSYYGEDGSFSINCGVSMNGMTSLSMAKKNMSLRFRGAYGASTLNYDIYGGGVTEFTNLLLRAGQDFPDAIVRNELCQELCAMTGDNVINQRSKFVILYINGQYSGIYTLKEKANEQLYASLAGVSRDSVTLLEPPVDFYGDFNQEIFRFTVLNNMRLEENYQYICDRVDMDSLIDFLIMEGFCANTDVGSGNMRFVSSTENDGKWRFMFYDLDSTFLIKASVYNNLMSQHAQNTIQFSSFVVPLMKNQEFKAAFLTRANQLLRDTLTNQAVMDTLYSLTEEIAPEVPRDYARFGRTVAQWEQSLEFIRHMVVDGNWRQYNIDALSSLFNLSTEERQQYFGEIDGK